MKYRFDQIRDVEPTNLTWIEDNFWYGWTYNSKTNRYFFDDVGYESLMELWEEQWKRESDD